MGFPTSSTLLLNSSVFPKDVKVLSAQFDVSLFDSPGIESDSWIKTGILNNFAEYVTGKDPVPPFEKIKSGFTIRSIKKLCKKLNGILKIMSTIFSREKYLLSFPPTTEWVL